jgi:hypothetical protein
MGYGFQGQGHYADMGAEGALVLSEEELAMLRTLRNQAVMAFRQTGG